MNRPGIAVSPIKGFTTKRIEKAIVEGDPVFGDHAAKKVVEESGWDTPEFLLQLALAQGIVWGPVEHVNDPNFKLPERILLSDAPGRRPPWVPGAGPGTRINTIGKVPEERIPPDQFVRQWRTAPHPFAAGARLESARPDARGFPGIEFGLTQAVGKTAKGHEDFGQTGVVGTGTRARWIQRVGCSLSPPSLPSDDMQFKMPP